MYIEYARSKSTAGQIGQDGKPGAGQQQAQGRVDNAGLSGWGRTTMGSGQGRQGRTVGHRQSSRLRAGR